MPGLVKENEGTERKVKYTSKFNELMELDDWMHSAPVPTWRCTGPRTKAHFTFQTSQEKCQYHRLITTLLLSQQLPPWLPPQNLLLQTGWCPHCSTIVSCSSSQWYSGCLFPSFLQILPLHQVLLLPRKLWTAPAYWDFSLWGLLEEHWNRWSWSFIGTAMSPVDLHGLSNKSWPWASKSFNFIMPLFAHLQSGS